MPEIATIRNWTPKAAHQFAKRRIGRIRHSVDEIAYLYGDVDNAVVLECDALLERVKILREAIDVALAEDRSL